VELPKAPALTSRSAADPDWPSPPGLVQLSGDQVRFRHGLMRSAVYHLASPSSRVAGHLALARAVGPGTDRGILHRARAGAAFRP
jgi:hypothetical protein